MSGIVFLRVNWTGRESEKALQGVLQENRGAAWIPRSKIKSHGARWVCVDRGWAAMAGVDALDYGNANSAANGKLETGLVGPLMAVKPLLKKAGEEDRVTLDQRKEDATW